jgi:hypothetical protein
MSVFPSEFQSMLSPKGRRFVQASRRNPPPQEQRFRIFYRLLDPALCATCAAALDRQMLAHVETVDVPIPPDSISDMTESYRELLPKTMRIRSRQLNSGRGGGFNAAKGLGLIDMLNSDSMREFAQVASGLPLENDVGRQVIAYGAGDYSGPHNDHYPEHDDADIGYVALFIMLRTPGVRSQYLVYETEGHFSNIVDVASEPAIAIYHLPFWHFTTPLVADPKRKSARRWLIVGTFPIDRRELKRPGRK